MSLSSGDWIQGCVRPSVAAERFSELGARRLFPCESQGGYKCIQAEVRESERSLSRTTRSGKFAVSGVHVDPDAPPRARITQRVLSVEEIVESGEGARRVA